jgi:NADH-quinone oxidoreductase subunit F
VFFCGVHQEDVPELVEEHLVKGRVLERLLYKEPETQSSVVDFEDIPFFKKQTRIVLENCGIINPESIQEYIARDGYFGLAKALKMSQTDVIEENQEFRLRGRGGAGFRRPQVGITRTKSGSPKYIVVQRRRATPVPYG